MDQDQLADAGQRYADLRQRKAQLSSQQLDESLLRRTVDNDIRNALTPANQAKFDANLKRVEARAARKPFKARRLSNR